MTRRKPAPPVVVDECANVADAAIRQYVILSILRTHAFPIFANAVRFAHTEIVCANTECQGQMGLGIEQEGAKN